LGILDFKSTQDPDEPEFSGMRTFLFEEEAVSKCREK
jgi:hypothetical protein